MKKIMLPIAALMFITPVMMLSCKKEITSTQQPSTQQAKKMISSQAIYEVTAKDIATYPFLSTVVNTDDLSATFDFSNRPSAVMKFSFRWDQCFRPLGICISGPAPSPKPPTPYTAHYSLEQPQPTADGEGMGNVYMINDHTIALFPDQDIYCSDLSVPVTADIVLSEEQAGAMGKSSITILKARYKMHANFMSGNLGEKGYVLLNCTMK